jgi:glycerophosphoryl diester phosphodiesterase
MAAPDWLTARPIAHRGYHDRTARRIENTLPAAAAAVDRRFAIELDLQLTADNRPVVFHDRTFDRLTETTGPLAAKTLAEAKAARFKETDARIPTLEELLDLVDGRVPMVIELKSDWSGDRRLEQAVAPILATYSGPAAVMSFDPASMATMRRLAPSLPRGLIADHFDDGPDWGHLSAARRFALRHLLAVGTVLPDFVSYGIKALPANAPLLLHHFGMTLITWTVRTPEDLAKAREYTDQITFEGFDADAISI